MSLRNQTKQLFAAELEAMLSEMPFDKVRVTELARRVGTSPQNFYYHFADKYELVAWIIVSDFEQVLSQPSGQFSEADLVKATEKLVQLRGLYQKMFADKSQSIVETYMNAFFERSPGFLKEAYSNHIAQAYRIARRP